AFNMEKLEIATDEESLKKTRDKLHDLVTDYDNKKIELKAEAETLKAKAELARVARDRRVNLFVKVNKAAAAKATAAIAALAGGRFLKSTLERIRDLFKNLDKTIPLVGTLAEAIAGLTAWLMAAASNTFSLARNLAQMGQSALVLPGILAG